MAADLPSGRLVFFFSDLEGSTRLLTDLGDRYAQLLAQHQQLVRGALAGHGGTEISTEGDSFFAVFPTAVDAVAAAAAIQRSSALHAWPPGHEFRARIGLHLGQAILAGDNYVGIDVNRAARIAQAANGGQVVLSAETADAIAGQLPPTLTLADLGRHRLKDIGVNRLWQLDTDGLPVNHAPLRSLEAHPSNLPPALTPLVDREDETEQLTEMLRLHRLVTVTGAGGIGKSRVAVHTARLVLADFPDGVFYVDLASMELPETLAGELVSLLNVRAAPSDDVTDTLLRHLRDRRLLLVLDTADRLPGFAAWAARLAENCPQIRILVTARSSLRIRAERELRLKPLALPGPRATVESTATSPAVALFVSHAQAVDPAFAINDDNVGNIIRIVEKLDGIPLGIELAAAAMRLLSPAAILDRLSRSLPLPSGAAVDAPARHRTLRDTIEWSYRLLESPEQLMLQSLSVFAGDFDMDGVSAIAASGDARDEVPGDEVPGDGLASLGRLVDASLVQRTGSANEDRYRLLGTIREFAAAELAASGVADGARSRHARYCLEFAEEQSTLLYGPDELPALAALDRAAEEFRAALEWTLTAGDGAHLALRLAGVLARGWYLRGRIREAAAWLERALAADRDAPPEIRGRALHWLGVMFDELRDGTQAIERLERALAIQREIGDEDAVARELNSLGVAYRNIGDGAAAGALLAESLQRRRATGDLVGVATVLTNLGIVAIDMGQFAEAIGLLEEAFQIDRSSGATGGVAYSSSSLGSALLRQGRRDDALVHLLTGLRAFNELGDVDGVVDSIELLGEAASAHDPARAARLLLVASSLRDRERLPLRKIDETRAKQLVVDVSNRLTSGELDLAQADANGMDVEAAVAYALAE